MNGMGRQTTSLFYQNPKALLSRSLVQRFLTELLLHFTDEMGISDILSSIGRFTERKAVEVLAQDLGYVVKDRTRKRMIGLLLHFLSECGQLREEDGTFTWCDNGVLESGLLDQESETAREVFKGQVDFFERCLCHADGFLKGAPPLYRFDDTMAWAWEEFLADAEFTFARSLLVKLLFMGRHQNLRVLDLCYGPGFGLLHIQEHSPHSELIAVDHKNIFHHYASCKVPNPYAITWVDSGIWKGFGSPLPFPDNVFDIVFFTCADPYIPPELRKYVYGDIFRVLHCGGSLGILSHSYPDTAGEYVRDPWMRRGIFCHDFSESVCKGWNGFYDAQESIDLFHAVGFKLSTLMLNASLWRLDKL